MMRHELYLENSYVSELETVIENINEFGVKLKNTIFYPRGGGQPEDKGVLIIQDETYEVLEIKKFSDGVYLKINEFESLSVRDTCVQKIDWVYRYKLMKHHTVLHILSAVVWDEFKAKVTGGNIYEDKARLDFDMEMLDNEIAEEMVRRVNTIISQNHRVDVTFENRDKLKEDSDLIRTVVNLIPESVEIIRIVKIGDVDIQADGGLHVKNTSEIGKVKLIKKENKGKGRKRISVGIIL